MNACVGLCVYTIFIYFLLPTLMNTLFTGSNAQSHARRHHELMSLCKHLSTLMRFFGGLLVFFFLPPFTCFVAKVFFFFALALPLLPFALCCVTFMGHIVHTSDEVVRKSHKGTYVHEMTESSKYPCGRHRITQYRIEFMRTLLGYPFSIVCQPYRGPRSPGSTLVVGDGAAFRDLPMRTEPSTSADIGPEPGSECYLGDRQTHAVNELAYVKRWIDVL